MVENEKDKEVLMTECKDNQNLKIAVTELREWRFPLSLHLPYVVCSFSL